MNCDKKLISFYKTCSINLCENCKNNHIEHNIVKIDSIKLIKNEIEKCENNLKENEDNYKNFIIKVKGIYEQFIKYQIDFLKAVENFKNANQSQINSCYNLIKSFKIMDEKNNLNYEIIIF